MGREWNWPIALTYWQSAAVGLYRRLSLWWDHSRRPSSIRTCAGNSTDLITSSAADHSSLTPHLPLQQTAHRRIAYTRVLIHRKAGFSTRHATASAVLANAQPRADLPTRHHSQGCCSRRVPNQAAGEGERPLLLLAQAGDCAWLRGLARQQLRRLDAARGPRARERLPSLRRLTRRRRNDARHADRVRSDQHPHPPQLCLSSRPEHPECLPTPEERERCD